MSTEPPGPRGVPVLGNSPRYARDPFAFLTACADAYGDIVRLRLGPMETYMLTNPDDIERVLVAEANRYRKPKFQDDAFGELLGDGLLLSDGETWRRQRELAQPAFDVRRIDGLAGTMTAATESALDGWTAGRPLDVQVEMARLTVGIIARAMFGTDFDDATIRRVQAHLEPLGARFEPNALRVLLPDWTPTRENREYHRAIDVLEEVIDDVVAERRGTENGGRAGDGRIDADAGADGTFDVPGDSESSNDSGDGGCFDDSGDGGSFDDSGGAESTVGAGDEKPMDLLSVLLRAQRRGEQTGEQLRDEMMTMLLAGHDTTALALTYTWYLLSEHPEVEARFHDELDEVLGGAVPTASDVRKLRYTEQVLKESMRLYPPVYIVFREAKLDVKLAGYRIPEGSTVMLPQWVVHRSPRYYEDPEAFDPDRWEPSRAAKRPRFSYFPFGGGQRHCIGKYFSMLEAKLILGTVGQRYRLEYDGESPIDLRGSLTMHPREPMTMVPHPR
ncbi:MAG: cytochrome P450 [Halobacteriota archaeon]